MLKMPTQAFLDLTTAQCKKFNEETPDAPGVRYFSVAGRHNGSSMTPEWYLSYNLVLQKEGDNDGIVSVASAQWGESLQVWDGDHFSLVNWLNPRANIRRGLFRDPGLPATAPSCAALPTRAFERRRTSPVALPATMACRPEANRALGR